MKVRSDGSLQSSNTPTYKNSFRDDDNSLYRCMVMKVIYADDPSNFTKNSQNPEVLYDTIVLGGFSTGQIISSCRLASNRGGDQNRNERTLKATTKDLTDVGLSNHDGDIVFVQFVQGHSGYPVIIGLGKGINDTNAATAATGPRDFDEFNGVITEINNKGEYSLTRNGLDDSGLLGQLKMIEDQVILGDDKNTITFFKAENKVVIDTSSGIQITVDGASKLISIVASGTEIDVDGNSGKISLKGSKVDIGASVSDFVPLFTQLLTAFNMHQHISGTPGSATSPPLVPLLSTVGSQTVQVQP